MGGKTLDVDRLSQDNRASIQVWDAIDGQEN